MIGFVQQVRHLYLLPVVKRGDSRKAWEKLFHQLRAVLRVTGDVAQEDTVPDRKTVLDMIVRRFRNSDFLFAELYQSLSDGFDVSRISYDIILLAFESLRHLAWRANSVFASQWSYPETRYFADREILLLQHWTIGRAALSAHCGLVAPGVQRAERGGFLYTVHKKPVHFHLSNAASP